MSAPAYTLEQDHADTGTPEKAMFCAALALLLEDARRYHRTGRDMSGAVPGTGRRALSDLLACGPMVNHLCRYLEQEPEWVCLRFARSLGLG
jgi:hypothetical protein